jgi:uncharacterized protein DUF4279
MADEIGVKLSIISDSLTPSKIDEHVGIRCTDSQTRGEMNQLGTKAYEHHAWFLRYRYEVPPGEYIGDKIDSQIGHLLETVKAAADNIKELSRHNSVIFGLYFYARNVPPMALSKERVERIAALGASLDIDLILYGNPESTQ